MPRTVLTTGSRAIDREVDQIWSALSKAPSPASSGSQNAPVQQIAAAPTAQTVRSVSANYTQMLGDYWILVDATAGPVTVSLLSALAGTHSLGVKKVDVSANAVTIDAAGTDLIDGAGTKVLAAQYDSAILVPDGTSAWWKYA